MIVNSSNVGYTHSYSYHALQANNMFLSKSSRNLTTKLTLTGSNTSALQAQKRNELLKTLEKEEKQKTSVTAQSSQSKGVGEVTPKSKEEVELEILKRIMEILNGYRNGKIRTMELDEYDPQKVLQNNQALDLRLQPKMFSNQPIQINPTVMTKFTAASSFFEETEVSKFSSTGVVKTADGREINFGLDIEMSRRFTQQYEAFEQVGYIVCDPLVINLDTNIANVTDQKFLFDLNCDGKEESISFTDQQSGFLAIDKNKDGSINDGSELFGTKTGDGFGDLSQYDKDHNGWIDEADEVFNDLVIWTKDVDGVDKQYTLKEAGVGAIYLESADTQFSLNNEENKTNAIIRKTGIYLTESGRARTIQHLDLTI